MLNDSMDLNQDDNYLPNQNIYANVGNFRDFHGYFVNDADIFNQGPCNFSISITNAEGDIIGTRSSINAELIRNIVQDASSNIQPSLAFK